MTIEKDRIPENDEKAFHHPKTGEPCTLGELADAMMVNWAASLNSDEERAEIEAEREGAAQRSRQ